jgi:ligand-binding sensor domain-containing protein
MRKGFKKISAGVFFSLCLCTQVTGQYDTDHFTRYTVKDGLTDNAIICLQQDAQGYIWVGTDAGLNRFDGKTFKQFNRGMAPFYLPSPSIWRMKRFGTHDLGIVTRGGFQMLNTRTYEHKTYLIPDSSAMSPILNTMWDVVELQDGSYAMTSAAGFYVFDRNGRVTLRHDEFNTKDIGKKRMLYGRDIYPLGDKKYLAFVNEEGVGIYDDKTKTFREEDIGRSPYDFFIRGSFPDTLNWIVKFQIDAGKYLFIPVLRNKIVYYDRGSGKKIISTIPEKVSESLNWESRITQVNDSIFLLTSRSDGFYMLKLDRRTGAVSCDGKVFLKGSKILSLLVDKDKRLWVGTTQGLFRQEMQRPMISVFPGPTFDEENYVGGFSGGFRHDNKLYVGRFSLRGGMVVADPNTLQFTKEISFFNTETNWNEVRSIEMYYKDTLWIGTNGGILWYATKTGRYGKLHDDPRYEWTKGFAAVLAPARSDGYAWMCSMLDGKVARYHIASRTTTLFTSKTTPALPFDKVKHVVYDSYGDVWIGGHSLTRWNNKLQLFDTLITVYGGPNKFHDDIVIMRADDNGSLWMHNPYNGLLEYRIREKKFIAYGMKDGLGSDMLISMSPVIDGRLWLAASNNLTLFDTRTRQFTIYDGDDGLPEEKPYSRRIFFDKEAGQLYLFTYKYLVRFPYLPERKRDLSSDLIVEELDVDGKKVIYQPADHRLDFGHRENNLTINYSIIDFEKGNYQFAWRMNDNDPWTVVGQQRSISFNNLAPGRYHIQLKASGKPGIEKIKTISFTIASPVWKRTWFIALAAALLAGSAFWLYRRRIRSIRQKANIDRMLSQTEMKALQAQMNPHFIFNSLNSIREMILNNENKDASHYLSKFAHLIRITLDQSTQTLVSLRSTIDYLQRYMEMESIRNSLFTYEITAAPELDIDEVDVPPMLIQPFIENALWHGVSANNKKIHIKVDFSKKGETLVCMIDDNGMGIRQSQKNNAENNRHYRSHGIANIRNRVELLNEKYDLKGRFTIEDKKEIDAGSGTLVTLHLPIEIKES